jgi:hypothetical protein
MSGAGVRCDGPDLERANQTIAENPHANRLSCGANAETSSS